MPRIILLILLIWLLFVVIKRFVRYTQSPEQPKPHHGKIVRCVHCGLYIPENESINQAGQIYCQQPACVPSENPHAS